MGEIQRSQSLHNIFNTYEWHMSIIKWRKGVNMNNQRRSSQLSTKRTRVQSLDWWRIQIGSPISKAHRLTVFSLIKQSWMGIGENREKIKNGYFWGDVNKNPRVKPTFRWPMPNFIPAKMCSSQNLLDFITKVGSNRTTNLNIDLDLMSTEKDCLKFLNALTKLDGEERGK